MKRPTTCSGGFTLIEVVIAMAIGVLVVVAVIGTVQSLARAAKTMESTGAGDEAWLRFVQIVRRDLHGWTIRENRRTVERNAAARKAKPFFECQTTSDGLAGCASGDGVSSGRMAIVSYAVRREGEESVIVRTEKSAGGIFEVPVLRGKTEPRMEFFDGQAWHEEHQGRALPAAVRISLEKRVVLIDL